MCYARSAGKIFPLGSPEFAAREAGVDRFGMRSAEVFMGASLT